MFMMIVMMDMVTTTLFRRTHRTILLTTETSIQQLYFLSRFIVMYDATLICLIVADYDDNDITDE